MDCEDLEKQTLEELLELYLAKFGEQFPLMLCQTMEEKEVKKIIIACIVIDTAWKPKQLHDADY